MNDKFDELAKGLAQSITRRGALKKFGVGLAITALSLLGVANAAFAGDAPRIRQPPVDTFVEIGSSALFFVLTEPTAEALTYQWLKEGSAIGGATNSTYRTPALTANDSGASYAVAVENSSGAVVSGPGRLVVASAVPLARQLVRGPTGNLYGFVAAERIEWEAARTLTESAVFYGQPAHLATIASAAEDTFLDNLRGPFVPDIGFSPFRVNQFWVGGFQLPNQLRPGDGWMWVNNEGPIPGTNGGNGYAGWAPGEPNDYPSTGIENDEENYLVIGRFPFRGWNDSDVVSIGFPDFYIRGYVIEIEVVPPDTTILSATGCAGETISAGTTTLSKSITLRFAGTDESGIAGFEYSLDDGTFLPCSSSVTFSHLALGEHVCRARAIDNAGNPDPTPAQLSWTVVTPAQSLELLLGRVDGLVAAQALRPGLGNSLKVKLDAANRQLNRGDSMTPANILHAFLNEVGALTQARILNLSEAEPLLNSATEMVGHLNSPGCD